MVNNGSQRDGESSGGNQRSTGSNGRNRPGANRRRFLRTAGAGVAATAFAGCLTGGGGGGGGGGGSGIGDSISIGVLAPEPGDNPIGTSIANSAKLAAEEANQNGGVNGAEVDVTVKDTKEDPATGRSKYQELTLNENVDVTTGVFTSEVLLNIMDDIAQTQTVHLTTGAATPEATRMVDENYEQYKYFFRTGPVNAHYLGQNMIDFLKAKSSDLGWESVAVLVEDYKWTQPITRVLEENLGNADVDVVMNRRYASGTKNFSSIYDDLASTDADAAYVAMAHTGTQAIVQWAKQKRQFAFGGIHVPAQFPSYYESTNGACRYAVVQNSATPDSEITKKTVPYANAYQEQYGNYPVYTGYHTYDAVKQYLQVVSDQGSLAADDVVSGLENSQFLGTTGTVAYYGKDHRYTHDLKYGEEFAWPVYFQWKQGQGSGTQKVVYPDDLTQAEYEAPSWLEG